MLKQESPKIAGVYENDFLLMIDWVYQVLNTAFIFFG